MNTLRNRQLYLHARPSGIPTSDHIHQREVPVRCPAQGQVLIENLYLSMDPAIRGWMSEKANYFVPIALGEAIRGSTLGRIIESRHPDFRVGDHVVGIACNAWEDFSVVGAEQIYKVSTDNGFPLNYHVSIFSAVGLTPYFGVLEIGKPQPGETALISAAAGACGSLAGQIARIKGCRVVGMAGTDEKCRWIVEELGFDAAINYKTCGDLSAAIGKTCPQGVDIFFDNVGGEILDATLLNLNKFARVIFCGAIANYNTETAIPGPYNYWQILAKSATVRGFLSIDFLDQFPQALEQISAWLRDGQLTFAEDIVEGLEHTVEAFSRLFTGENKGKLMVRLRDERNPAPLFSDLCLEAEE
ncbi:NADP-dependent oxidoreductase [Pseudomonas fluorescens]|uniref:NADP-dependent oxidoreductase YfmJ n=1 Tax=Pseudomonas fluorescens TaxID=294 RepID=A0A5E7DXJ1_PSEFL|nr:NADP-dependent oxidoreductase [Pseudomonas fluorescens]VVO21346.1 Putative NADP-dependent oxidoreductase YfmJ [Pseudomonas fluorescens]